MRRGGADESGVDRQPAGDADARARVSPSTSFARYTAALSTRTSQSGTLWRLARYGGVFLLAVLLTRVMAPIPEGLRRRAVDGGAPDPAAPQRAKQAGKLRPDKHMTAVGPPLSGIVTATTTGSSSSSTSDHSDAGDEGEDLAEEPPLHGTSTDGNKAAIPETAEDDAQLEPSTQATDKINKQDGGDTASARSATPSPPPGATVPRSPAATPMAGELTLAANNSGADATVSPCAPTVAALALFARPGAEALAALVSQALAVGEKTILGQTALFGNPYEVRMPQPAERRARTFDATHSTAYVLHDTGGPFMNSEFIFHSVKLVGDTIWVYNLKHDAAGEASEGEG
jgi:hypothetical protein